MIRIIHDTDTAGDDATALMMALKASNANLEAVTVNCGNVAFDQEVENALYTIQVAGKSGKVPVYPGARHPLLREWETAESVHGKDGMGDSGFPRAKQRPEQKFAVEAIVDLVNSAPGEITLVATGPLTNIALAVRKDPSFAKKVKRLYFMGGTNQYIGNVTPAAEFNIWVDPDAAKIVFHSGMPTTMVGWEICMRHGLVDRPELDEIAGMSTTEARFFTAVNRRAVEFTKEMEGKDAAPCPDSITMAIVLNPAVATDVRRKFVDVDNESELSRGATYVDHLNILKREPNLEVVYSASERLFKEMLFRMLRGQPV
ncbi:MAG TPA: nucleoside hydrolase [Nitrososphaerales archaeon]|nr:nucleoside hydrolase [Nitrososphaerales archaeon]